ncbi:methyltransferase [Veronia nyctiphanis]|uniref:methyltransferase n=1 Tax=Veronia nyctiphanis TaxID=1278244 RepID=UPI002E26F657
MEWQESLCQAGQEYADKHSLPMKFVQGDAFSPKSGDHVLKCDHAVALHACGDLHVRLIQHAVNARTAAVSISPCCYHLINDEYYMPLSSIAKASHLKLDKDNLKLPLQESVTAGQSVRSKRFVEVSFRLGFDSLLRDRLGIASYVPVPSIQKSLLGEGFERFCIWAAKIKGITLPEGIDYHGFLAHGEERFFLVEQMETVRTIFRRPLELWLVLDRVLFLKEQGYEVSLGEFCERELTPRNVLIQGKLAQ